MSGAEGIFARNLLLYGPEGFARLQAARVAVFGIGGVGGYAAEALVRGGVGGLRIVDCDVLKATDVNRQLLALTTTLGESKVAAAARRLKAVNPELDLDAREAFFHTDTAAELLAGPPDFVIDAIDSLAPKAALIAHCRRAGIPILSVLGASSRTDPFRIRLAPLDETAVCPLARALRRYLRGRQWPTDVTVLYSTEPPITPPAAGVSSGRGSEPAAAPLSEGAYVRGRPRRALPSLPTLPGIMGLMAANHCLFALLGKGLPRP